MPVGCLKAASPAPPTRPRSECFTPGVQLRGLSVTIAARERPPALGFSSHQHQQQQQQQQQHGALERRDATAEGVADCAIEISAETDRHDNDANGQPLWWLTSTTSTILIIQGILIILFTAFVTYAPLADGSHPKNNFNVNNGGYSQEENPVQKYYHNVMAVHLLVLAGVGLRLAFIRDSSYGGIGMALLTGGISIQWAILCNGYFSDEPTPDIQNTGEYSDIIDISLHSIIRAQISSIGVSVSQGAVLGLVTPQQVLILTMAQIPIQVANVVLISRTFKTIDLGGAVTLHLFSAVYGVSFSRSLGVNGTPSTFKRPITSRTSQLAAYLGSVYLVVFLPSVWSANLVGDDNHRTIINTLLATFCALVMAFPASSVSHSRRKFSLSDIQCGMIGGFVAVGGVANLMLQPFGALLLGGCGSVLCITARHFLRPIIRKKLGIHDVSCVGVSHGLGGLVGGLAGVVMAALASRHGLYGFSVYEIYPAMAPTPGTPEYDEVSSYLPVDVGEGRSPGMQAAYQLLSVITTVLIATAGGILTGLLLRLPFFDQVARDDLYTDSRFWQGPSCARPTPHARHRMSRHVHTHPHTHAHAHGHTHTQSRITTPSNYRKLESFNMH